MGLLTYQYLVILLRTRFVLHRRLFGRRKNHFRPLVLSLCHHRSHRLYRRRLPPHRQVSRR